MILYREKAQIRLRIYNITTGLHEIMFDLKQHNFILLFLFLLSSQGSAMMIKTTLMHAHYYTLIVIGVTFLILFL